MPSLVSTAQIENAAARVLGRLDQAIDEVNNFDINEIKMKFLQGSAAKWMGEIFLNIDYAHRVEAETWIRKSIGADEQNRMPWDLARAYALYAEFFKKKSNPAQAKEKLGKAIDLMRSIGADGWVEKYEEELAEIE